MSFLQEKRGAVISYFTIAFYIIAGFLYTPFLIKTLGMSDYGLFTLSASLIAYFSIDFGIGTAQTRFIARYIAEKQEYKVKNLLGITVKLYLLVDVILILILTIAYLYSEQIFTNLSVQELQRFQTIFVISSCFVLFNFPLLPVNGIYIAYDKIVALKLFDLSSKVITVLLLVVSLLLGYGLYGVVLVSAISTLIIQIIKLGYLYNRVKLRINLTYRDKDMLKSIGAFSVWATIAMLADKMFFSIIPILLAIFSNTEQIAYFAVVISIEGYVLAMSKALNGVFLPRVMQQVVNEETPQRRTELMIKVGRIQLFIVGLFIIGLLSLGKEFFYHWLGKGFDISYYALIIVLIPCLFHLTQTIAEESLLAQNKIKYRAYVNILGSIFNVIAIVLLCPKLGAIGAAIGVFLCFVIAHNIMIDIFYHKVLKINMVSFLKECHMKILPSFIIASIIGILLQKYIYTPSFVLFIIKALAWGCVYIIALWFMAFNQEEKKHIKQLFKI